MDNLFVPRIRLASSQPCSGNQDGYAKPETILEVIYTAEKFAKELGMVGVKCTTLDLAFAELTNNFKYEKFEGKPPERAEPLPHTRLDACINCDPVFCCAMLACARG